MNLPTPPMKTRHLLSVVTLFIAMASFAHAQDFELTWTFDAGEPDDVYFDINATTAFGPVQVQPVIVSSAYSANNAYTGTATYAREAYATAIRYYNPGDFFGFTFSPTDNTKPYTITGFDFSAAAALHGATLWELRTSLDDYSLVLGSGATSASRAGHSHLNDVNLTVDAGEVFSFRIIGTGGDAANAFFGLVIDSVSVQGSIGSPSAVPEPSTYALIFGTATLGLVIVRRRRRQA